MDAVRIEEFRDVALLELKRAERYRTFLSLLVLNLSELLDNISKRDTDSPDILDELIASAAKRIKQDARETDKVSFFEDGRLAMLLPETDFTGARAAAGRIEDLVSEFLAEFLQCDYQFSVPLEITSFPGPASDVSLKSRLKNLISEY